MPLSFPETERPALIVGQDGILRAGWQPAPNVQFTRGSGGLPTRRRLPTCPTTCAEFADLGKLSGIGPSARHARLRALSLLLVPLGLTAHPCQSCHPKEVAGYSHSSMARSLRRPGNEPGGTFTAAGSGTRFTIRSDSKGAWQRTERAGEVSEYQVEYVIGSGSH